MIYTFVIPCNAIQISEKNELWINQGIKDGVPTFQEQGFQYGLDINSHSSHAQFFDFDRDGDLDLFIGVNVNEKNYPNAIVPKNNDGTDPNRDQLFECIDSLGSIYYTSAIDLLQDHLVALGHVAVADRSLAPVSPAECDEDLSRSAVAQKPETFGGVGVECRLRPFGDDHAQKPAALAARILLLEDRAETEGGAWDHEGVCHLFHNDVRCCGHPGAQQEIGVIDAEDRLVSHHAVDGFRGKADLGDRCREGQVIVGVHHEGGVLAHGNAAHIRLIHVDLKLHLGEILGNGKKRRSLKRSNDNLALVDRPVEHDAPDG